MTTTVSPTMFLSEDAQERKDTPITTGVIDYFPRALAAIAQVSKAGNDQHNPGQPLHWDKSKSTDHADCIARHLIDRHTVDSDGKRHVVKLAWRAMALLETTLEQEANEELDALVDMINAEEAPPSFTTKLPLRVEEEHPQFGVITDPDDQVDGWIRIIDKQPTPLADVLLRVNGVEQGNAWLSRSGSNNRSWFVYAAGKHLSFLDIDKIEWRPL